MKNVNEKDISVRLLTELVGTLDSLIVYSNSETVKTEAEARRAYLLTLEDPNELAYPHYSISKRQMGMNEAKYPSTTLKT